MRHLWNPFELVIARRPEPVTREAVPPERPSFMLEGFEYLLERDDRVRIPDFPVGPPSFSPDILERVYAPPRFHQILGRFRNPSHGFHQAGTTTGRLSSRASTLREALAELNESPETLFREAVRICVKRGASPDRLREIWDLEVVDSVMDS